MAKQGMIEARVARLEKEIEETRDRATAEMEIRARFEFFCAGRFAVLQAAIAALIADTSAPQRIEAAVAAALNRLPPADIPAWAGEAVVSGARQSAAAVLSRRPDRSRH